MKKILSDDLQIVYTLKNNQVILALPAKFRNKKEVSVYVEDQIDIKSQKLDGLKMAARDPLFLADIREIHADFDSIDDETLNHRFH